MEDREEAANFDTKQSALFEELSPENGTSRVGYSKHFEVFRKNNALICDMEKHSHISEDRMFPLLASQFEREEEKMSTLILLHKELIMTNPEGRKLRSFPEEYASNSCLTEDEYMTELARTLGTPENIEYWRRYFFQYTFDSDDSDYYQRNALHCTKHFYQTVPRTLRRIKNGRYLGDCEDLMAMQKMMLEKLGYSAFGFHVHTLHGAHITTICFDIEPSGKYSAHDLGTFGYCKNGALLGGYFANEHISANFVSPIETRYSHDGYFEFIDAVASVLHRYKGDDKLRFARILYQKFKIYKRQIVRSIDGKEHSDLEYQDVTLTQLEQMVKDAQENKILIEKSE